MMHMSTDVGDFGDMGSSMDMGDMSSDFADAPDFGEMEESFNDVVDSAEPETDFADAADLSETDIDYDLIDSETGEGASAASLADGSLDSAEETLDLTTDLDGEALPDPELDGQGAGDGADLSEEQLDLTDDLVAAETADDDQEAARVGDLADEEPEIATQTDAEAAPESTDEQLRFGELPPNATLERNGYVYETDAEGRVTEVYGDLQLGESHRTGHQTEVGHMGMDGDEGGHLVGARFGGSPEGMNIVPQDMHLNRSDWKVMENEWQAALEERKDVNFYTSLGYDRDNEGPSARPSDFIVTYMIDGEQHAKYFPNSADGAEELL